MEAKVNVHELYLEIKGRKKTKKTPKSFDKALFSLGIHHDKKEEIEKNVTNKEKV